MKRHTAQYSFLIAILAVLGCGDADKASDGRGVEAGAGGQPAGIPGSAGDGGAAGSGEVAAASGMSESVGATAGAGAAGAVVVSKWRYPTDDEGVFPKDRVLDVQVNMPPEAWTKLIATARDEAWSTANVTIDGQSLGDVGFRPKGEYSLDTCVDASGKLVCDKLSFKLKFDQVNADGRFYGMKRLVLNQVLDGASVFLETLAYQVFRDFGVIAPRTSFAVLKVNGTSLGLYRVIEVVDGRFTHRHFPDGDGNLYKEAWPVSSDDTYYEAALETNEGVASHAAFKAFAADMLSASDAALPESLGRHVDLKQICDYMAVDYGVANWDGITTFYSGSWGHANHNYYWYEHADTGKFTLIPWDLNATLFLDHWLGKIQPWDSLAIDCSKPIPTDQVNQYTVPAACDPTIRAMALSKEQYRASVRRLLDEVFIVDRLSKKVDEYTVQIAGALQSDPFVTYLETVASGAWVKSMLPKFRARLEAVANGTATPGAGGSSGSVAAAGAGNAGAGGIGNAGNGAGGVASNPSAATAGAAGADAGAEAMAGFCASLCAASTDLECYAQTTCASDCETKLVDPLRAKCPDATLIAFGDCLLKQAHPTTCSSGLVAPDLALCPTEFLAIVNCAYTTS